MITGADVGLRVGVEGEKQARAAFKRMEGAIAKTADRMSGLSIAGNLGAAVTGLQSLANAAVAAGAAIVDFAEDGAAANDILAHFTADMQGLRDAVAGSIDDTSLQSYSLMAEKLGLTAREAENYAKYLTYLSVSQAKGAPSAELLAKAIKSPIGALKQYGVELALTREELEGLSSDEKVLARARKAAAMGADVNLAALDSESIAIAQMRTEYDNLMSTLQQTVASSLVASGGLEQVGNAIAIANERAGAAMPAIVDLAKSGLGPVIGLLQPILDVLKALTPVIEIGAGVLKVYSAAVIATINMALWPILSMFEFFLDQIEAIGDGLQELIEWVQDTIPGFDGLTESLKDAGQFLGLVAEETGDVEAAMETAREAARGLGLDFRTLASDAAGVNAQIHAMTTITQGLDRARHDAAVRAAIELQKERDRLAANAKATELYYARQHASARASGDQLTAAQKLEQGLGILGMRYQWLSQGALAKLDRSFDTVARAQDRHAESTAATAKELSDLRAQRFEKWLDTYKAALQEQVDAQAEWGQQVRATADALVNSLGSAMAAAIVDGQNFGEALAGSLAPTLINIAEAYLQAAMASAALFSGQWWMAAAASIALGVAAAALNSLGGGSTAAAGKATATAPRTAPTTLSRPEETRREAEEREVLIVQLEVDGRSLAAATFRGANRAVQDGSGLRLSSRAVSPVSRSLALGAS